MRKYLIFPLMAAIVPNICFGASARYTQLVREKQRKVEELEKCLGTTKNLQIAGLSTLGLTAAGIAGNIAEAKIVKENEKTIEGIDKKIERTQEEIKDKEWEIQKEVLRKEEAARQEQANINCLRFVQATEPNAATAISTMIGDIENCEISTCITGYELSNDHKQCLVSCTSEYLSTHFAVRGEAHKEGCYLTECISGYHIEGVQNSARCVQDVAQQCSKTELDQRRAISGIMENGICKVQTCKGQLILKATNVCECPDSLPQMDSRFNCKAAGAPTTVVTNPTIHPAGTECTPNDANALTGEYNASGVCVSKTCKDDTFKIEAGKCVKKATTETHAAGTACTPDDANALTGEYNASGVCVSKTCKDDTFEINSAGKCVKKTCTPSDPNATAGEYNESGECISKTCKDNTLEVIEGKCERKKCTPDDPNAKSGKYNDSGVCESTMCKDDSFELKKGKCIQKASCTPSDPNALTGEMANGICIPKTCKGDLVLLSGKSAGAYYGKKCSCPEGKTQDTADPTKCVEETLDNKPIANWTSAEINANPEKYCERSFTREDARACCMEVRKGNATSWDGSGMKCNCKANFEWNSNNNKCENTKDKKGGPIYYTKNAGTYYATVDGVQYSGHKGGVSFSSSDRDRQSLKLLKQHIEDAGYTNFVMVQGQ